MHWGWDDTISAAVLVVLLVWLIMLCSPLGVKHSKPGDDWRGDE